MAVLKWENLDSDIIAFDIVLEANSQQINLTKLEQPDKRLSFHYLRSSSVWGGSLRASYAGSWGLLRRHNRVDSILHWEVGTPFGVGEWSSHRLWQWGTAILSSVPPDNQKQDWLWRMSTMSKCARLLTLHTKRTSLILSVIRLQTLISRQDDSNIRHGENYYRVTVVLLRFDSPLQTCLNILHDHLSSWTPSSLSEISKASLGTERFHND